MQSTIYVEMAPGVTIDDLYRKLLSTYEVCFVEEQSYLHTPKGGVDLTPLHARVNILPLSCPFFFP